MRFVLAAGISTAASLAAPLAAAEPIDSGNVRIAVACDAGTLAPETGLSATIDGQPAQPVGDNIVEGVAVDSDGNQTPYALVTDVGFRAPLGHHHLELRAPMCTVASTDIDVVTEHATLVAGRLPLEPAWQGPTGTPSGLGFVLAASIIRVPTAALSGTSTIFGDGGWSANPGGLTAPGVTFGLTYARRHLLIETDSTLGWTNLTGTATNGTDRSGFHATELVQDFNLRIGGRIPLHSLELGAGTGVGFSVWDFSNTSVDQQPSDFTLIESPSGTRFLFHIPVWAELTYKPGCDWGVTATGTYQFDPTDSNGSNVTVSAGLMWQPNAACSERPGLTVR
ncbi:MAG TPA: hypothetical protein VGM88_34125 [Kofleriaceae bacterium]